MSAVRQLMCQGKWTLLQCVTRMDVVPNDDVRETSG